MVSTVRTDTYNRLLTNEPIKYEQQMQGDNTDHELFEVSKQANQNWATIAGLRLCPN